MGRADRSSHPYHRLQQNQKVPGDGKQQVSIPGSNPPEHPPKKKSWTECVCFERVVTVAMKLRVTHSGSSRAGGSSGSLLSGGSLDAQKHQNMVQSRAEDRAAVVPCV